MELNLTELDIKNKSTVEPFDYTSYTDQPNSNYWEKQQLLQQQKNNLKKKKVTFDDILTNMNLVVNKQGVLQFMSPIQPESAPDQYLFDNNINEPANLAQNNKSKPIEPEVKHSYIYNKYFKDYASNTSERPAPRVPKNMEEYRQMLIEDRIKAFQHKKMVEQVKSKKMIYTNHLKIIL